VEGIAGATIFFFADSRISPIDQIEALKPWLVQQDAELARIFVTVDCQLAERQPILKQWFAACIHFADVVFLTKREGVANKWLSDFIKQFTDEYFPCYFIQVKTKGDLSNPLLLLDPTPRRVSQYFEEGETYEIEGLETDDDDEELDENDTGLLPEDPYFARDRSGRRVKELPDFREYLSPKAEK
jgi:G3E family GTPase